MIALCDLEAFVPEVALFIPCPFRFTLSPSTRKPAQKRSKSTSISVACSVPYNIIRPGLNRT